MKELSGKTSFVTGAASGIGRATAHALAEAGANVMIADVDAKGLEQTADELARHGVGVAHATLDIADADAVNDVIKETVARFGSLDLAHNNAGILGPSRAMADYPLSVFRQVIDVNVMGTFHCMQAQLRQMLLQGKGSIVNTASTSGVHAMPDIGAYTASKHAVIGLTKAAAVEYSSRGIRVNCVCPGFVKTKMADSLSPDVQKVLLADQPMGRFSEPEEIAQTVLFLLSDRSSFSTGSAVFVDGGATA